MPTLLSWTRPTPNRAESSSTSRLSQADEELTALINRKFSIKCTTGYAINALVDISPDEPVEMIKKLMVRATYNTVEDYPYKASTFILYPSFHEAGRATAALKKSGACDAIEVFDRAALHEAEKDEKMVNLVPGLTGCDKPCAGLLVECRGASQQILDERIAKAISTLNESGVPVTGADGPCPEPSSLARFPFRHKPEEAQVFWDMRKGLIPKVGAQRTRGTSMLIEDVACEVDKLADMSVDLIDMFERHGYGDASVFGHAMEGNMHLVFYDAGDVRDCCCQVQRVVEGRARHGTKRFSICRDGVGRQGLCSDVAPQGSVRSRLPAEPRRAASASRTVLRGMRR